MSARFVCVLVVVAMLAALSWQHRTISDQAAKLTEAEAANVILREHAAALLKDSEVANAALMLRETAHDAIDTGRARERQQTVNALSTPAGQLWGVDPLPADVLGLLYGDARNGYSSSHAAGTADAGDARADVE